LKLFGFGLCCFFSDKWNVADFVMVSIAVGEICMVRIMYEPGNSDGINASTIRLLRILRVFRMASIFDRLSLLIHAFICALYDVVWVGILIVLLIYIFAILCRGFLYTPSAIAKLQASGFDVELNFGTVPKTMVTLFQVMTMDSWASGITKPIGEVFPGSQLFFIMYVIVASLGLLNLLTTIFIDTLSTLNNEQAVEQETARHEQYLMLTHLMENVFKEEDKDNSGTLTPEEMQGAIQHFQSDMYQQAFASVGLDLSMVEGMVKHLDADLDGLVSIEEFVSGVEHMTQDVVKADIWVLEAKNSKLSKSLQETNNRLTALSRSSAEQHSKVCLILEDIQKKLDALVGT